MLPSISRARPWQDQSLAVLLRRSRLIFRLASSKVRSRADTVDSTDIAREVNADTLSVNDRSLRALLRKLDFRPCVPSVSPAVRVLGLDVNTASTGWTLLDCHGM